MDGVEGPAGQGGSRRPGDSAKIRRWVVAPPSGVIMAYLAAIRRRSSMTGSAGDPERVDIAAGELGEERTQEDRESGAPDLGTGRMRSGPGRRSARLRR